MNSLNTAVLLAMMLQLTCQSQSNFSTHSHQPKYAGLTLVAPPSPFPKDPMVAATAVHANAIAVVPYGFTRRGESKVHFNIDNQWWGEREAGVRKSVEVAHKAGVKVMIKPQVWGHNLWTGDLDFETEEEWLAWQKDYAEFILFYADLAAELQVEAFCLGTEFKIAAVKRETFWRSLIAEVRHIFPGVITYAANWDHYQNIPFWDALDFAGINAYFPLADARTPSTKELWAKWQIWISQVDAFYEKQNIPIVFTEFGYLSVDGCAYNTWELEGRVKSTPINERAQANALQALFDVWSARSYWQGGFLWKWFPNMQGHEGYPERDYTPQGKEAETVIAKEYQRWQAANHRPK